ncbi:MAG: SPFH domain-containing protein [Candidatus Saccharibacteria bacterium]|nr:SPFH domain-containing protein [Candidatus Saccharibacteria bacterium]
MEVVEPIVGGLAAIALLVVGVVAAAAAAIVYKVRYKIAGADEALVITGSKKRPMQVLPGGGAFVPLTRKWRLFPLGVMTVSSDDQETQTSTMIPIVVRWTAQLRVDTTDSEALRKAVQGFSSSNKGEIIDSLQQTLDGEVRAVVATMTPEGVIADKSTFAASIMDGVAPRMADLGFELVSLNIAEVTDRNGYYKNLAAQDHEEKRKKAAILKAEADQEIRVDGAKADEKARTAELQRDLALKEKQLTVDVRTAAIKAETDVANADAEVAGELRRTERAKEVAANEGAVAVVRADQDQKAADAERAAVLTRAETEKQKREIQAEAEARTASINAKADAEVATARARGSADAMKISAEAQANASRINAEGEAAAIDATATAEAERIRKTGLAEAEVAEAQGKADAAAILAKGEAEAEVQRKMADALAANEGANLQVTLAEIRRDTTIEVATTVGQLMASVGENATFIDMGGSSRSEGGNLLSDVLGSIPGLMKTLDVQNEALNGVSFAESIGSVVSTIKGASD